MTETYAENLIQARESLRRAMDLLNREIQHYPTPISGCDAQFNYLIAERTRIGDALNALGQSVFVPTPRSPTRQSGIESR